MHEIFFDEVFYERVRGLISIGIVENILFRRIRPATMEAMLKVITILA